MKKQSIERPTLSSKDELLKQKEEYLNRLKSIQAEISHIELVEA